MISIERIVFVYDSRRDELVDCTSANMSRKEYRKIANITGWAILETQKKYSKETGTYHASVEMLYPGKIAKKNVIVGFQSLPELNCVIEADVKGFKKTAQKYHEEHKMHLQSLPKASTKALKI